jgi:predicted DNA-binding ribbon-helix-helix protein
MKAQSRARAPAVRVPIRVERVQTGVRLEKRLLKVLRALADSHDMTLGDLIEGMALHAFEGRAPFGRDSLRRIAELKRVFGLDLDARASHRLVEDDAQP